MYISLHSRFFFIILSEILNILGLLDTFLFFLDGDRFGLNLQQFCVETLFRKWTFVSEMKGVPEIKF